MKLEDLRPSAAVRGLLQDGMITVVSVQWHGSDALTLIYETAIAAMLRQRIAKLSPDLVVRHHSPSRYLARVDGDRMRRAFALLPDVTVSQASIVRLIADTKWKRLELTRSGYFKPNRADMYQMHAYASAFRVSRLVLIYPADPDWGAVAETSFVLPGTKRTSAVVSVACVDVEDDNLPITVGANTLFNNLTPA
jgi:5-methylcytosine-specific restriction endonuclease McrBC regulatory subunit McrC